LLTESTSSRFSTFADTGDIKARSYLNLTIFLLELHEFTGARLLEFHSPADVLPEKKEGSVCAG